MAGPQMMVPQAALAKARLTTTTINMQFDRYNGPGRGGFGGPGFPGGRDDSSATNFAAWVLVFLVGYAPFMPGAEKFGLLVGYHIGGMGLAFMASEATNRRYDRNELRTDGTYSMCRYPLYGGLVMAGIGASMVSESPERLAATVLLYLLLSFKARQDDRRLERVRGQEYFYWAEDTPRVLPDFTNPSRIFRAISGSFGGGGMGGPPFEDRRFDGPPRNGQFGGRPFETSRRF